MTAELKKFLTSLLNSVKGLYNIVISDRDGVPLISVTSEKAPEMTVRGSFLSTFGMATDQGNKVGLGKNNHIICIYSKYQVIQINKLPMIITFVADTESNTGHILSLENKIEPILSSLKNALGEA